MNTPTLHVDPSDSAPIWRQVEEGVGQLVAVGVLAPGAAVPSVRELSRQLRVNPATVSKAYRRLVGRGVLVVRRGEGTYVAERPPEMSDGELDERLAAGARRYAALALTLGAGRKRALEVLERVWRDIQAGQEK